MLVVYMLSHTVKNMIKLISVAVKFYVETLMNVDLYLLSGS